MNNSILYQEGILGMLLSRIQRAVVVQEGTGSDSRQSPGVSHPSACFNVWLTFYLQRVRQDTAFRLKTFTKVDFNKPVFE